MDGQEKPAYAALEASWKSILLKECAYAGSHTFDEVVVEGTLDPIIIVCNKCGTMWEVVKK